MSKSTKKLLFIFLLFIFSLITYTILRIKHTENSKLNYTSAIKNEINTLINTKKCNCAKFSKDINFDTISKELDKNEINSVILIDKKFKKQIKYPFHNLFIEGYNVLNLDIKNNILALIKKYGINYFLKIKTYKYIPAKGNLINGYYVINIPIKGIYNNKTIGYYIVFIKDKFKLMQKEIILYILSIFMAIIFFILAYLIYKKQNENEKLIKNLDKKVKKQVEKNLKLMYIDSLTGAYKKNKFDVDIKDNLNKYIVMLNIKNFSKVNKTYGFDIGDEVLKIVVKKIEKLLNRKIYRVNADEFLFISDDFKKEIKEIKNSFIFDPIKIESIKLRLSFSFGIAKNDGNKILRKVTIALKESKKEPFKDYIIYQKRKTNRDEFIKFNALLYNAVFLENKTHITPYWQGIRNNKTGEIIKYESLARLEDNGKVYSPFFFIEIAKNSGFLYEITKIMIDKSLEKLSTMDENISISINITEDDLFSNNLKHNLLDKLKKYNIRPQRIVLEILEGISTTGTKENVKQLQKLKNLGFKISIDDFGVEYSNFERINELDVDFIKIDGKYIKAIHTNPKSYQIAKAITKFAHSMDIEVIAEFVENEEIQKIVEKLEIDYSQGYYFSKPTRTTEI